MHQPVLLLARHEAEVAMLTHWIEQLCFGESALELNVLLVLWHGFVLIKRKRAATEVASEAFLAVFLLGYMPAKHLEHEGDLESLVVDFIKGQDFLEKEGVRYQKGMKSRAVEKREGVDWLVEIHLTADIIHTQVKFLSADLGRLFVVIQTSLLVQADHL